MRYLSSLFVSFLLFAGTVRAAVPQDAVELFRHGMYERAMVLFSGEDDPLSQDYAVLCAVKLGLESCQELVAAVDTLHPRTVLNSTIHYEYSLKLFDAGLYPEALTEFEKTDITRFDGPEKAEVLYKHGYCLYDSECYDEAAQFFLEVTRIPQSQYLSAARYALGCHCYQTERFSEAIDWFNLASGDPRFKDLCDFYLLDCRFMLKDYDYVISRGELLYPTLNESRAKHIARLISEAWLVKGNPSKAKDFLLKECLPASGASDKDYFHAASVLYATGDFSGAIEYFNGIKDKTDSIGQVALYQMGYSYVKTKNKILALEAFKGASQLEFDENIREDAFFNYAKLAFDINSDTAPFKAYIERYNTSRKGEVIYSYIAITALAARDYEAAVEAYDQIEELDSDQKRNYIKANFLRADQLQKSGSWRQAVKFLRYAAIYLDRLDPLNQMCRYYLAEALYRSGDYAEALDVFKQLYNESALAGTVHGKLVDYNIAYCSYMMEDYPAARKSYDRFLVSGEKTFRKDALLRRADCDFSLKDYSSASRSYGSVIQEYPDIDDIYPYYRQALSYGLAGDVASKASVLAMVSDASASSEWYCPALYEYGRSLVELGRGEDAIKSFALLRSRAQDSTYAAKALLGSATVRRNSSDFEGALSDYKRVVSMLPGSDYAEDALLGVKLVYTELGEPEKYQRYLEDNGLDSTLSAEEREQMYFETAEQVFMCGRYPQASSSLLDYIARYPQGRSLSRAFFYLGECARMSSEKENACDWYAKSLEVSPDGSFAETALLSIGRLKYDLQVFEDSWAAFARLTETARLKENHDAAVLGRMRSGFRTHRYEDAVACASAARKFVSDRDVLREINYIQAMSYLTTSRRSEAFALLKELRREPSTPEGAEAAYLIIRSQFDWGNFESVQNDVYDFASKCGDQTYWLAKAFIVLGDSFVETGNKEQAKVTFQSLLDGYQPLPEGDDVIRTVTEKLSKLQ